MWVPGGVLSLCDYIINIAVPTHGEKWAMVFSINRHDARKFVSKSGLKSAVRPHAAASAAKRKVRRASNF